MANEKARKAAAKASRSVKNYAQMFDGLAEARSTSFGLISPRNLSGLERRLHVRNTIRGDHRERIEQKASGAEEKFEKLAGSVFSFFRGTALLFYRDMVGTDAHMPTVLVLGDVHPENFGIMPNANNVPIFGVNDFDETFYAPFTWDLKRGVVAFMLAAEEVADYGRKKQRKIAKKFLEGYYHAMKRFAEFSSERHEEFRIDNSPKVIKRLFKQAHEEREDWLWDDYLKPNGLGFKSSKKLSPVSDRTDEFQGHINALAEANGIDVPKRAGELKVKDVAVRHGQGTASLGLDRYYVLIEGPSRNATDDIIIEFKRARDSALEGLVPPNDFATGGQAERIKHGQNVQLAHGDIFYGAVEIDGESFMSRERAPFRDDIDLEDLSYGSWKDYAFACGMALAQSHALSDDSGEIDYDVEPAILDAMRPEALFLDDMLSFADEAAVQLRQDHAFYCRDYELGAFRKVEGVYR